LQKKTEGDILHIIFEKYTDFTTVTMIGVLICLSICSWSWRRGRRWSSRMLLNPIN